jgi:hypothetical protein
VLHRPIETTRITVQVESLRAARGARRCERGRAQLGTSFEQIWCDAAPLKSGCLKQLATH